MPHQSRPNIDLENVRSELSSALISDVLDSLGLRKQCLAAGLAPLDPKSVIAGWAYPVAIQRVISVPDAPFQGLVRALDEIGRDEVFVTPTYRATDIAVWGELLSTACVARSAAGAITDGLIRDTRAIRELAFPVMSAGTIPYDSMGRHEVIAHRVPCLIDGVRIEPGDFVIGDSDGVTVVPLLRVEAVIEAAFLKRSSEMEFKRAVSDGVLASDAFARFGVL